MNTKQIEELKKKYPLIEVPNIDWVRQQTAKEIIEMCRDEFNNYTLTGEEIEEKIKSKYGIGEKDE
jgi:hypothetical protein